MYFEVLLRYRTQEPDGASTQFGIGGGVITFSQTRDLGHGDGRTREERHLWPNVVAVQALRSIPLSDRLNVKFGMTALLPVHVQPVVLFAWGF